MTKTTRLMLAVLAVCGTSAALAQSSVTLYGRVNTTIEHQKLGNQSATGLVSNSSFIGFRGQEDLGNGLKAGFVLESQFNADNGSGAAGNGMNFERNSEINLSGNFGMLRLGSFDPVSYSVTADYISMHNHDTGSSADALYYFNPTRGNALAYRTPTFAGLNAEVQYHFGEKKVYEDGWEDKGAVDLGVSYENGPLGLGFGYSHAKEKLAASALSYKFDQVAVRASYALGDLVLGSYYQHAKAKVNGASVFKRNVVRVSAMYTMGASEFHANIGRADKAKYAGFKGKSATQWTLAYNYNLSKRTKVYALYSSINHAAFSGIGGGNFDLNTSSLSDNAKFRTMAVGVRHLF